MLSVLLTQAVSAAATDKFLKMLGADDIQGKKAPFLAGSKVFYVGGTAIVQHIQENETIGLMHPFFHDLRSRGTGITTYDGVGTGNDLDGWEWYRATKVAAGSIIVDGMRWEQPAPTHMFWRPDKLIVEYNLTNPNLAGVYDGWCQDWKEGSSNGTGTGKSFWTNVTESECWSYCEADSDCLQA
eukprot:7187759-Prymnesium_polylepis.1